MFCFYLPLHLRYGPGLVDVNLSSGFWDILAL